jgi:hypothetical protein
VTTSVLEPPLESAIEPVQARRVANRTADEKCEMCGDDGTVIAASEIRDGGVEYDVAGPCPRCEKGFSVEFGIGRDRDGFELRAKRPPWGPSGFWRGRPAPAGLL